MRFTAMNVTETLGARLVSLEYAKRFLRADADVTDQDSVIAGLIEAVQGACEDYLRRSLFPVTVETTWDCVPKNGCFALPFGPAHSVESFEYHDDNGDLQTLATTVYQLDSKCEPSIVYLKPLQTWPSIRKQPSSIIIKYRSGMLMPVSRVESASPQDLLEAEGHWLAAGDKIQYNVIGGDAFTNFVSGRSYTVSGVQGDYISLHDGAANVQPGEPTNDEGIHVLGRLPQVIVVGFLQLLSTWAEIREGLVVGTIVGAVPETCKKLWYPHRCLYF